MCRMWSSTITESTLSVRNKLTNNNIQTLSLRFNGHSSRWIWVSRYQNVSIIDVVGAKGDGDGEW